MNPLKSRNSINHSELSRRLESYQGAIDKSYQGAIDKSDQAAVNNRNRSNEIIKVQEGLKEIIDQLGNGSGDGSVRSAGKSTHSSQQELSKNIIKKSKNQSQAEQIASIRLRAQKLLSQAEAVLATRLSECENTINSIQANISLGVSDSTVELLQVEQEIFGIINGLGRSLHKESATVQSKEKDGAKASEQTFMARRVESQTYAQYLEERIEGIQRQLLQNKDKILGRIADSKPLQDLDEVIGSLEKFEKALDPYGSRATRFKDLLARYLGVEERSFKGEDIETLKQIEGLLKEASSGKVRLEPETVKTLKGLIEGIRADIKEAFLKRCGVLGSAALDTLGDAGESIEKLFVKHDLYWDFHNPLEAIISYKDFIEMANNHAFYFGLGADIKEAVAEIEPGLEWLKTILSTAATDGGSLMGVSRTLNDEEKRDLYQHKLRYLRKIADSKKIENSPQVVILGGGPGGLMHALVAGLKGANVSLYEKREAYTRQNPVALLGKTLDLLNFFGFFSSIDILKVPHDTNVFRIKDIEGGLKKIIEDLFEQKGEKVIHTNCEVVDLRLGSLDPIRLDSIRAGCLIKQKKTEEVTEVTWHPADFIVDATGASARAATILGQDLELLSSSSVRISSKTVGGIEPNQEEQKRILELKEEIAYLQEEIGIYLPKNLSPRLTERKDKCQNELDALIKQIVNRNCDSSYTPISDKERESLIANAQAFIISIGVREAALLLGDCLVTQIGDSLVKPDPDVGKGMNYALQSAIYFSKTLEGRSKKLNPAVLLRNYIYSGRIKSGDLISTSAVHKAKARTKKDFYNTLNYGLRRLKEMRFFTEKQRINFKRLMSKVKQQIPFTEIDREHFKSIEKAWDSYVQTARQGSPGSGPWELIIFKNISDMQLHIGILE